MKNVTKRIFAILSAVFMMFGIISESTLSVSAASVTLSTTVSTLDGKTGQTFNLVDPGNITISNWKRSTNQVVYNGGNKQSPNWTWSQLSSAGSGSNWETDLTKVWDGSRSSTHNFSGYLTNGTVTALGSNLYDSATWLHKGTNETQSTINRFQGEFNIGSLDPNNYAFTISTVTGDNIYINDNIFVFVYPKGTTITNDNYRNYFAFWTGTVTKFVSNASYLGYSATNLLGTTGDTYTGLNNITDGWHLTSAQDNVGDIILST